MKKIDFFKGGEQWHETLSDDARIQMPSYLRALFSNICVYGEVQNISKLWKHYRIALCEDFVHRYSEEIAIQDPLVKSSGLLKP